ncbi:hypothetical protein JCM14719A_21850 [Calditerricola satsumensis]
MGGPAVVPHVRGRSAEARQAVEIGRLGADGGSQQDGRGEGRLVGHRRIEACQTGEGDAHDGVGESVHGHPSRFRCRLFLL